MQEGSLTSDTVKDEVAEIFDEKVGAAFSDEDMDKLFVEAENRYAEETPPGYKDGKKHPNPKRRAEKRSNFGDYVLWRQIMNWAQLESKDVILVTDDRKEDWWLTVSGKTVSARPELKAEFCQETGRRILFYNPDKFLQVAEERLGVKVSDKTIDEIRREHVSRSSALIVKQERELQKERVLRKRMMRAREMEYSKLENNGKSILTRVSKVMCLTKESIFTK